ncbi:hypothetical protein QYF36_013858 [Acer negundo]|nr:hypothetical protein QYF36_013858 [Acer negundo]
MPRASKKQKDKGASGSGSSIEVCNPNFHVRLENNLGRAILSERNMDLNNLLGFEVSQMVDAMGWRQLVTTTHRINESAQDINRYYSTQNHGDLDTGVPKLAIFRRYNLELARDLCMPHVVKPWDDGDNQLLQHDLELIWAFWERLDVGKIIRRAITQAARVDSLVMPFPALITYFCEQASLVLDEGDHIAQMDGSPNSRTFNDISTQRNEEGLQVLDTRKRRRRDDAAHAVERAAATADEAEDAAEEDLGVVPTSMETRQSALEARQAALEKGIADLTNAIKDSYLSALRRQSGVGLSSKYDG